MAAILSCSPPDCARSWRGFPRRGRGIREVFQAHRGDVQEMPLDDPMTRLDLNTPQAYESAYTLWGTIDSD